MKKPVNQALLDHLAISFVENGWSVKKLIKQIVMSHTYQLSSEHSDANYAVDPGNNLVWRMNRRRLDAGRFSVNDALPLDQALRLPVEALRARAEHSG